MAVPGPFEADVVAFAVAGVLARVVAEVDGRALGGGLRLHGVPQAELARVVEGATVAGVAADVGPAQHRGHALADETPVVAFAVVGVLA
jgi:hypothetical protein